MYAKLPGIHQSSPSGRRPRDRAGKRKWGLWNGTIRSNGVKGTGLAWIPRGPPLASMSLLLPPDGSTCRPALVLASQSVLGFGQTQGPRPRNSLPYFLCSSTLPIYGWSLGTLQFCFVLLFQMNPAGEGTLLVKCGVVAQQHPRVLKQGRHSMPQHK